MLSQEVVIVCLYHDRVNVNAGFVVCKLSQCVLNNLQQRKIFDFKSQIILPVNEIIAKLNRTGKW